MILVASVSAVPSVGCCFYFNYNFDEESRVTLRNRTDCKWFCDVLPVAAVSHWSTEVQIALPQWLVQLQLHGSPPLLCICRGC